eukprot:9849387-Ditylum_brightwellii.AAC.1
MCNYDIETQQSAEIRNGATGPSSTCSLHTEQIAPNLMCNYGTEAQQSAGIGQEIGQQDQALHTQQSAGIGLERDDDVSTISNDQESSWMVETQQSAGIGQLMGQQDQALHVLLTRSKSCQT